MIPSSWHGTRVVGVYGALTDNAIGVAGMSWGPWILPVQLAARLQSSANLFPAGNAGLPTCPALSSSGECACPNDGSECGAGMVDACQAVSSAQKPIGVIAIPTPLAAASVLDASTSVAACNTGASPPAPLAIATVSVTADAAPSWCRS